MTCIISNGKKGVRIDIDMNEILIFFPSRLVSARVTRVQWYRERRSSGMLGSENWVNSETNERRHFLRHIRRNMKRRAAEKEGKLQVMSNIEIIAILGICIYFAAIRQQPISAIPHTHTHPTILLLLLLSRCLLFNSEIRKNLKKSNWMSEIK